MLTSNRLAVSGGLVFAACLSSNGGGETASSSSSSSSSSAEPDDTAPTTGNLSPDQRALREGPWEVVVDALPFPVADIHALTVGRKKFDSNFANRGLVEVLYDHEEETITIETRKYVIGDAEDTRAFDRLSLWAYIRAGDPTRSPDPADDCTQGSWRDNCAVYAYYDGKAQPVRSGMDLRLHLPFDWRGRLLAETEDNDYESDWPRRGDITIDGLCGGGEVILEAGRAAIRLCRGLVPAPTCPLDQIEACAAFPDGSASEAWSPGCPCGADQFGQLLVRAPQPWAADVTVDIPEGVWLSAALANDDEMRLPECAPTLSDCDAPGCVLDDSDPFAVTAEFNHPSPAAPDGAGFSLDVRVGGCTAIPYVEPGGDLADPLSELRGRVKLCSDCL